MVMGMAVSAGLRSSAPTKYGDSSHAQIHEPIAPAHVESFVFAEGDGVLQRS